MEVEERRKIGLKYLKTIDGEVGDEVIKALDGVAGDIGNYILEFAFGEIYNRKSLNLKQREMITITSLLSQGGTEPQLKVHINGALNVGLSQEEILETFIQCIPYVGFPKVLNAVESHQKATYTTEYGGFKKEIVDIIVDNRKGRNLIVTDENIRSDTSIEKLAKLKSAFKESGVVTAGNSSSINDGASILMLVSEKILYDYKLTPLAEWIDSSLVGLEPRLMGMGPEIAVKKLLTQQKMDITDIDIFELNEAFAAQSIACIRQLGINDMDKVNPKGGAIALGHPVGASGSRILTTLIYELIENKGNYGITSLCIGGGMGAATLIKNANSNL